MRRYRLQRRQHPLFSPVATWSTLMLVAGLGVGVFLTGGRAFSPGELSAVNNSGNTLGDFLSHAVFSDDCARCHTPFQGVAAAKCEACHEDVAQERQTRESLHGRFEMVEKCGDCHTEHQGTEFDLLATALADLDHDLTGFSLARHQEDYAGFALDCTACHVNEMDFALLINACSDCHGAAEPDFVPVHTAAYGNDCLACHDGVDRLADFTAEDHVSAFALVGAHSAVTCEACHTGGQFEGTPDQCEKCHAEPAIHQGLFSAACTECHTPDGWKPATMQGVPFDHTRDTLFSLAKHVTDFDNTPFTCLTCHNDEQFLFPETGCVDCHATAQFEFITTHAEQVGTACLNCHDGSGQIISFDHSQIYPLIGKHLSAECTVCHTNQLAGETPSECLACHEEPDIHLGIFGTDCANCHTAEGWLPALLQRHAFSLDHGEQGEVACATCHAVTYTEYTCYGCHDHDPVEIERGHNSDGITFPELAACTDCHPTGARDEAEVD
jgi:hypothetical protein